MIPNQRPGNSTGNNMANNEGEQGRKPSAFSASGRISASFSLRVALLLAVLGLGWAFNTLIYSEIPVGKVEGQVLLSDLHKPLGGVQIVMQPTGRDDKERQLRRTTTDANGHFKIFNVKAGDYNITASARSHASKDSKIDILEGRTSTLTLNLERNEVALEMKQHQRVFGTREHPQFSVSGYLDAAKALATPPKPDLLHLRIFKTHLSNVLIDPQAAKALEEVGRNYDATPNLPVTLLHPEHSLTPQLILQKDVVLNTADREGFFYQKLDLKRIDGAQFGSLLHTGLYLVEIKHEKKSVCTWLLVTDTALIVKRDKTQVIAYAVDMHTGIPVPNSEVRTYRNGKVVSRQQTDARGIAQMRVQSVADSEQSDSTRVTTVVVRGTDEAVVERNADSNESGSEYTVHAYTDRPVYRPGQRVYFKGIARRLRTAEYTPASGLAAAGVESAMRYTVPAGEPVDVEVRDKGGERLLKKRYITNRYGAFFGQIDLLREAATGVYTLVINIGGSTHTEDIYVASYRKPEFAVTVTPDKKVALQDEIVHMTIEGKYFFGSPVAGAKVHYSIYSSPDWSSEFADANADTMDSNNEDGKDSGSSDEDNNSADQMSRMGHFRSDNYYGSHVQDGNVTLDENGRAIVSFKGESAKSRRQRKDQSNKDTSDVQSIYDAENGPQEQIYTCSATVTLQEGREVEATGEARLARGAFRLTVAPDGYVAAPKIATNVTLAAHDFDGNSVPNVKVSLEMGYENWKKGQYTYTKVGILEGITGTDGRAFIPVIPPRAGTLLLKARAFDADRHLVLGRASLWVTGDQGGDLDTTYEDLSLLTDKRRYKPGETARVLLNCAHLGQTVLLTVEGERVQRVDTIEIKTRSTVIHVPILAQYGPNVFLAACYVQNKHYAQSETPLRVAMPQNELKVTVIANKEAENRENIAAYIAADKSDSKLNHRPELKIRKNSAALAHYSPGERITYSIQTTDKQGRPAPCELSFGVVDEAIYALREDDPKALRQAFYPRRVNAVSTEFSFAVEYLGDADKTEPKIETRKKFPDTAYWDPALLTDANGRATVSFALPDSLTTWRATATALTTDTKIGRTTNKVLVTKDFFVRLETPRTLTQHDQSRFVAVVHNETTLVQTALVKLSAENLTVMGEATQTLTLQPKSSAQAVWSVTADGYGESKLKVTAWTPKVEGVPQYTDGLETTLPIRPHGREEITAFAGDLTAERNAELTVPFDAKAIPTLSKVTIRVTPSIASSLVGGLDYLIGYPYGCVEQTLSRILPDMEVRRALKTHGMSLNAAETRKAGEIDLMVREGLQRLYRFQHVSGAWGWWEHDNDDPWMTGYVLLGLATARAEGFTVSEAALARGRKAGIALLAKCKTGEQPFLMYGLALAGERNSIAQARREMRLSKLSSENLAYIVLLDELLGHTGSKALALLNSTSISHDSMVHWQNRVDEDQDDMTATAMALRVMLRHNAKDTRIAPTLRWLMFKRTGNYWSSTRDTAWVLTALSDYLSLQSSYSAGGEVRVAVNGKEWQKIVLNQDNLHEKEIVLRVPSDLLHAGDNHISLTRNGGSSPIFYSVDSRQTIAAEDMVAHIGHADGDNPIDNRIEAADAKKERKLSANSVAGSDEYEIGKVIISREYLRVSSKQSSATPWIIRTEPTNNKMQAGDRIRVRLTLSVPRDMAFVLIEDAFPAGCEVSERGDADDVTEWGYWWSSVDVRDDRIAFFARSLSRGTHVIEYNLKAQNPGSYHTMPALMQAMYAPETKAESAETRVEIKP